MDRSGRFDGWVYRRQEAGGCQMSTDAKVVGYCRACGKPLDAATVRTAHGTIYCEEHLPMENVVGNVGDPTVAQAPRPPALPLLPPPVEASPYTARIPPPVANPDVSPGLAFGLGMIP